MVFLMMGVSSMIRKMFSGILILMVATGVMGCSKLTSTNKFNLFAKVEGNIVDKNKYTATVEANSFYIMSEINGRITDISINQGDDVKQSQSVLKIDSSLYDIQKRQAQSVLDLAKAAQVALTENPKQSIQSQSAASVAVAQAAVDTAQLQIDKCTIKSNVTGTVTAVYVSKGQVVSPSSPTANNIIKIIVSDFDSNDKSYTISTEVTGKIIEIHLNPGDSISQGQIIAQIDPQVYEVQKAQALANLSLAKAQQSGITENPKESMKSQAQASIDQAQAGLDIAELQVSKCNVVSQSDGVIEEVYVNRGEIVSAGMNIAKVLDINNRYVKIYVEESRRNNIKLRQNVLLYVDNKSIGKGTIEYIAPESEFTPKNTETKSEKNKTVFQVKVKLDSNVDAAPGAMVDVDMK